MIRPGIRRLFRLPIRRKDLTDEELDEEIRLHLELRIEQLERRGLTRDAARAEAVRRFGPVEEARRTLKRAAWRREERMGAREWMDTLGQDLRFGARQLRQSPVFATVAVLTIALGIGATTAIFSVVDAVLLRPLSYGDSERLVALGLGNPDGGVDVSPVSYPEYRVWARQSGVLEALGAYAFTRYNVAGGEEAVRVNALGVTPSLLPALDVRPLLGRNLSPEGAVPGGPQEVLLTHGLWRRVFGGDPAVVGRVVDLDGAPFEVVGVLPRRFAFPPPTRREGGWLAWRPEIWVPAGVLGDVRHETGAQMFSVVGRLRPGATAAQARAELLASAAAMARERGRTGEEQLRVVSMHEMVVGPMRPTLLIFVAAVGLVLLIATVNLGSLLLARLTAREQEVSLRVALGAGRGRIVRQMLTECLLLATLGGAVGVFVAWGSLQAFLAVAPGDLPRLGEVGLSGRVLVFSALLALFTGLLFGLLPVLRASRPALRDALAAGGRGIASERSTRRLHSVLVAMQVTLVVTLLAGAGLLIRSFGTLMGVDPGFDRARLLTLDIAAPPDRYPERESVLLFFGALEDRLGALPGVRSVGAIDRLPFSPSTSRMAFGIVGRPAREEAPRALNTAVRPGYFETMGIPVIRGRAPDERDREDAAPVVLVSRALAERYWPGESPVGERIEVFGKEREVVGVVGDVLHLGPTTEAEPMIYIPHAQDVVTRRMMTLVVRTSAEPERLISAVRAEVQEIDPRVPVANLRSFDVLQSERIASERFNALLVGSFAALALFLAAVGVYGVMTFAVASRTRELGVRMALGATAGVVLRGVLRHALAMIGIGGVIGLLAAIPLSHFLRGLLFGVEPGDPLTFGAVAALLAGVGVLAAWLPARRAARIDPVEALRHE